MKAIFESLEKGDGEITTLISMEHKRHWCVTEKRRESHNAVTLLLAPDDGLPVSYLPGQYLSIIRQIHGQEKRRAYSFSSCPGVDSLPAITIKRIPNGEFSNWLIQEVQVGDRLLSGAPAGQFLLPEKPPEQLVYLAAGSGITPILSQLKYLLQAGHFPNTSIALFYANRDSANTIFKKQLDAWMREFPNRLTCTYLFSREKGQAHALNRHLNNALFEELLFNYWGGKISPNIRDNTQFYLCAPKALMRMAQMTLRMLDFPAANIHKEDFVPATHIPTRVIDPGKTHRIIVSNQEGQRQEFEIFSGETILNGALRQGIELPYTCKSGVCFSCLARCVRGEVEVNFVEQTRREGPGALVNTCIGHPVTEEVLLNYE